MLLAALFILAGATDCHLWTSAHFLKHTGDGAGDMHQREVSVRGPVHMIEAGVEAKESGKLGAWPRPPLKWTLRVGWFYCRINCCSIMYMEN